MPNRFLQVTVSTLIMIGFAGSSLAQTPKEVLEPYKAYRTALDNNKKDVAADFAFKAWQRAEDLMGDTKTTGDLAANFAELRPRYIGEKEAWKHVMKAHKRSIDLSSLYSPVDDANEVEIDRRTKYLSWVIPALPRKAPGVRDKKYSAERLSERIAELNIKGSTFEAESVSFKAQAAMLDKDWPVVQRESIAAMKLFETRTDGIASIYEFAVPIFLARAYAEQDLPIDAALTYQNLMTKMEKRGGHDNPISSDAYGEWINLRDEVATLKSEDPRVKEVVNFVVPDGRAKELSPLLRKPPVFPSSFLKGNRSGFVKVKFNIDINGHVVDPVILSSTKESLHKPTLESLKGWRYTPNLPEARSRNIETTVRFNLQDEFGRRLKDGQEKSRL